MVGTVSDNTPVIIGVGQAMEPVPTDLQQASSYVALAARAAQAALDDAGAPAASGSIDTVVAVRTFEDTMPGARKVFNGPRNLPCAVAHRLGITPTRAVYEVLGGQSPQKLAGEFSEKLQAGECDVVLLFGVEVIANVKAAKRANAVLDWSEDDSGSLEDRGGDEALKLITPEDMKHKVMAPMQFYGLLETARRANVGLNKNAYAQEMGELFAPFSDVAARNPYAQFQRAYSAEALITPGEKNPYLASPYTKHLVSKDGVNQAAALLLTTVGKARALGVPESKWVYLHGYADTIERPLLERENLGYSVAMEQALQGALQQAGKTVDDIAHFDIYSCFPIVVFNARDVLSLRKDDSRALTQTGGLPFFGGPGNNYTMHGIASLVETLRNDPGSFGIAYGNGGWMSKHSAGVYSTTPPANWQPCSSERWQQAVDAQAKPVVERAPEGEALIESYLINYMQGHPVNVVIIGRLCTNDARFMAMNAPEDHDTLQQFVKGDPLDARIRVTPHPDGNRFQLL